MFLRTFQTLFILGLTACIQVSGFIGPFRRMFPTVASGPPLHANETGEPLFLSPYLAKGQWKLGQKKARVDGSQFGKAAAEVESYAGYLTVNAEDCKSNLFFWYFPAVHKKASAPVLLWLQGGPGGSSLFGLFNEHGPLQVLSAEDLQIGLRPTAWTLTHHVLYIDNPVGTGFSFTGKDSCYAKTEENVASDLYDALQQFFDLFPKLRPLDFYVTGESYAGKYVPAITHRIHQLNPQAEKKIHLKGMAIGDGLCDPGTMADYGDFLFNIGLIDEVDRKYFKDLQGILESFIAQKRWIDAFRVFDDLLNGDLSKRPSYFANVTGFNYYFNYLMTEGPAEQGYYGPLLQLPHIRKAIHVGNLSYNDGSIVEQHLLSDVMQSVKPWIQQIIDNDYKVMIYNGQLDIIIAWPLTENFLQSLKWNAERNYTSTERHMWHVGTELAGYVKTVGNFTQVLVRNAGHMVPYDQPKWAFDLIHRFTSGKAFD